MPGGSLLIDGPAVLIRVGAALDRARRYVDGTFWEQPGSGYTVAELWG